MLTRSIARIILRNSNKKQVVPNPPRFTNGELQPFRFDFENSQLYDGYTVDQLYGLKIGHKHPPAVKAQMTKDTIAASVIIIAGFGILYNINEMFRKQLEAVDRVQETKLSKDVVLPPAIFKNPNF